MSDLLTHWAVYDDARRLAVHDPAMEPLFARLMTEEAESARLGALARAGNRWATHILRTARDAGKAPERNSLAGRKVAFALGGIAHYAADVVMKPLMSEAARADWHAAHDAMQREGSSEAAAAAAPSIREVSAYYDVHVFRKVYLDGREEPFSRFLLAANETAPGAALEAFARSLFQRALLSIHTLSPPKEDFDAWLERLLSLVQPLYIDIGLYTRVFERPDPDKMDAFGVETRFYVEADPVVAIARAAQGGHAPCPRALEAALAADANRGGYGQAVALAMRRLRGATAFWRGEREATPDLKQG